MMIDVLRYMAFFLRWFLLGFFLYVVGRETWRKYRRFFIDE